MSPRLSVSISFLALCLSLCGVSTSHANDATAPLRTFSSTSLAEIKAAHKERPFVLALWSVNCAPCHDEMGLLAELHEKYPGVSIVLVAADQPSLQKSVLRFLGKYRLGKMETWQFGEESMEKLRYAIDKRWPGELPRTYFFDASHQPTFRSGLVEPAWLEDWLAKAQGAQKGTTE